MNNFTASLLVAMALGVLAWVFVGYPILTLDSKVSAALEAVSKK